MYRILIADDEGLMLEAFKGIILAEFGEKCIVETAKTGRVVIENPEFLLQRLFEFWRL